MTRGGGYAGQIRDLREDVEAGFTTLEGEVDDLTESAASGDFALDEGFSLNVLPVLADRVSILAAGNSLISIPLGAGLWYSITIEILIKNATQPNHYVYRNQIEAYRDGAGAVLHLNPTPPIVEGPSGGFGFYTVTIAALVNAITVQINNGSPNTITIARYVGYTQKPVP